MPDKQHRSSDMQEKFLLMLKQHIPPHLSLVEEISDTLDISLDSAYRRIRGEKLMLLDEIVKLAQVYGLSLESLSAQPGTENITFSFKSLDEKSFTFEQYLLSQLEHFKVINRAVNKELIYAAKDLPIYYYYLFPELAVFKLFVWKKSIMGLANYQSKKYTVDVERERLVDLGYQCLTEYCKVPSLELWNDESVNSTIRQIEVYYDMGYFAEPKDAHMLLDKFEQMIAHIEKQSELGKKFLLNEKPNDRSADYHMYYNEVVLCDNSILVTVEAERMLFLTHNTLNYLYINNREYCDLTHNWMTNLRERSTELSAGSPKARTQFFNTVRKKIDHARLKLI